MTEWLAYNDPFFTDEEPYCNTVRFITKDDAVAYWKRTHPNHPAIGDAGVLLGEFMAVHWAWQADEPSGIRVKTG